MNRQAGFTLIEIMVVVIIIGVLSAIVTTRVVDRIVDARIEAAKAELQVISGALKMYRVDNFAYPTTQSGLRALIERPAGYEAPNWSSRGYLDGRKVPQDPWGEEYQYLSPGADGADFDLYSLGPDRRPGGEGTDADIRLDDL